MMPKLVRAETKEILVPDLQVADGFCSRGKGLLGRSMLASGSGLWIHRCNSIHTYFMKFSIDCVFIDQDLVITSIKQDVKPWRLILPQLKAKSVIELTAGESKRLNLTVGEKLHVGA